MDSNRIARVPFRFPHDLRPRLALQAPGVTDVADAVPGRHFGARDDPNTDARRDDEQDRHQPEIEPGPRASKLRSLRRLLYSSPFHEFPRRSGFTRSAELLASGDVPGCGGIVGRSTAPVK